MRIKFSSLFQFRKPVKEVSAVPKSGEFENEVAVGHLIYSLGRIPDLDETLKQAGFRRDKLRVLLTDDEISQAGETRLDSLCATPLRYEPSEGSDHDFIMEHFHPWTQTMIAGIFQARWFGYSVMEAVYRILPQQRYGYAFIGEKPFEWFEPKSDGRLMYFPDDGSGGTTGIEVDQTFKFFLTRIRPTYRQPYGESLLARLYWPWFFRTSGWKFWAKFLERFGSPLLVG